MARTRTTYVKGHGKPGPGRPKLTDEERRQARLKRALDYDYKQELRAALPIAIDQVLAHLEANAYKPREVLDVVETLRDTLHGKPAQTLQGPGGGPLIGSFVAMLQRIDGTKDEKL